MRRSFSFDLKAGHMADGQRFVRVHFGLKDDHRRKLLFKHKHLRDVVKESGKSIGELFADPFGGWAYLIRFGLMWQDLTVTLDKASSLIDMFIEEPDPETQKPRTLSDLGQLLLDALNASGFIKIQADQPLKDDDDESAEGKAKPEAIRT